LIPTPPLSPLFPYTTLFRSTRNHPQAARIRPNGMWWRKASRELRCLGRVRVAEAPTKPASCKRRIHETSARRMGAARRDLDGVRSEEHTSELQSRENLVCRL